MTSTVPSHPDPSGPAFTGADRAGPTANKKTSVGPSSRPAADIPTWLRSGWMTLAASPCRSATGLLQHGERVFEGVGKVLWSGLRPVEWVRAGVDRARMERSSRRRYTSLSEPLLSLHRSLFIVTVITENRRPILNSAAAQQ